MLDDIRSPLPAWLLLASIWALPVEAQTSGGPAPAAPASGASADLEPAGYRDTVERAVLEFAAGHFEESRALFARAHALFPNARTLRGLGMAEFELRNYVIAIEHLEAALANQARPLDEDLRRIEAVLEVVGEGRNLCVDVNGRFDLDTAIAYGKALLPYDLFWYEEVGDPLDYALQAELAKHYDKPMATGENLFSHQDARNLIRHGGLRPDRDILQFDPALSYGLVEYLRTLEMLVQHGWSPRRCVPHGGHQFALNIAVGLGLGGNESYPEVFAPFGGFASDTPVVDGRIRMPDAPGIGFEKKNDLWAVLKDL